MHCFARPVVLMLLSLGLLACNTKDPQGADDEYEADAGGDDVVVDHRAPTVVSHIPEDGADNVAIGAPIEIEFSKPIDPTTVSDRSVVLEDDLGRKIQAERYLSSDGKTLTLGITDWLIPPRVLTLELTPELTDLIGNELEGQSRSWEVPVWIEYGRQLNSEGTKVGGSDFAFDAEGRLVATFFERAADGFGYLYVERWDENQWTTLGSGSINHQISDSNLFSVARIVTNDDGELFAMWTEGTQSLFMKRWSGNSWEALGGILNADVDQELIAPQLIIDGDGHPLLSWKETTEGQDFTLPVKRWDGAQMQTLSEGLFMGGSLFRKRLLTTAEDEPLVVHNTANSPNELHAVRWDEEAGEFVSLGSGSGGLNIDSGADARGFVAEMNDDGQLFVVWHERSDGSTHRLYARRWDGSQMSPMGSGPLNQDLDVELYGTLAAEMEMVIDSQGYPLVAWGEGSRLDDDADSHWYVKRWTGSSWELVGGAPFQTEPARTRLHHLSLAKNDQPLVVTTVESDGGSALYIHHFDGASWRPLGDGDRPILEDERVRFRDLVLLPDGAPVLFAEVGPAHDETTIRALEWWNAQWHDLGDPSLQRDSSRRGNFHRIKLDPGGLPVMGWSEGEDGDFEGDLYFMKLNRMPASP